MGEGAAPVAKRGAVGMVGLDADTGRRLWTIPNCLDKVGSPAIWRHGEKAYFLAAGERMIAVEPKTGKILWTIGGPDDRITDGCASAVSGDFVVVNKNMAKQTHKKLGPQHRGPSCYRLSQCLEGLSLGIVRMGRYHGLTRISALANDLVQVDPT